MSKGMLSGSVFALIIVMLVSITGCAATAKNIQSEGDTQPVNSSENTANTAEATPEVEITAAKPHNTVFPGDELSISVYRHNELSKKVLISPDGRIFFPLVGELDISNMSPTQIREALTEGLSKYIVDPQVSVDFTMIRSQKIFVLGEVKMPGVFNMEGQMEMVEAISRAGGFTPDAKKDKILLIRQNSKDPQISTFNMEDFIKKGELSQNAILNRGDIVYVPPSYMADVDRFFRHFENIIRPVVLLEQGIVLSPRVEDAFRGREERTIIITPP